MNPAVPWSGNFTGLVSFCNCKLNAGSEIQGASRFNSPPPLLYSNRPDQPASLENFA
jgi:hypothetical protein